MDPFAFICNQPHKMRNITHQKIEFYDFYVILMHTETPYWSAYLILISYREIQLCETSGFVAFLSIYTQSITQNEK